MIDRDPDILAVAELEPSAMEHTPAEVALISRLVHQKTRTVLVPMCRGDKIVQETHRLRNVYKPSSWEDIHPYLRQRALSELTALWERRFSSGQRERSYQHVIDIPFPQGTRYQFSLVADLYPDRIVIISPFKMSFSGSTLRCRGVRL